MAHLTSSSYPPHHHHGPAKPIPASDVLPLIQSYLAQSTTSAHLHPDCIFIDREGPTFSSNSAIGGVVLNQLRRVEAGLRGVWLGAVLDDVPGVATPVDKGPTGNGMDIDPARKSNDERLDEQIVEYETHHNGAVPGAGTAEELGNYQEQLREQGEQTIWGEIGGRTNAVRNRVSAPQVQSTSATPGNKRKQDHAVHEGGNNAESRKKAKKERNKEEKAKRYSERMAKRNDDHGGNEDDDHEHEVEGVSDSNLNAAAEQNTKQKGEDIEDEEREQENVEDSNLNVAAGQKKIHKGKGKEKAKDIKDAGDNEENAEDGSLNAAEGQKKKHKGKGKHQEKSTPDVELPKPDASANGNGKIPKSNGIEAEIPNSNGDERAGKNARKDAEKERRKSTDNGHEDELEQAKAKRNAEKRARKKRRMTTE